MVRYVSAVVCTLAGGIALVLSAFGRWIGRREGMDIPLSQLWNGLGPDTAGFIGSLAMPLMIATVLALIGAASKGRLLVGFAGLIGLVVTGLFMLQQGLSESGFEHLHQGWTKAGGGALLFIVAAVLLPNRVRTTDDADIPDRNLR
ncbi:hypothetical protein EV191_113112 [Tamaricihabitans halophyticus]|uniref:Uncharacterized protein n=1 Tax=Tamaricihabitans halophyticus TaxID=1262583 RepID=A0A4R2QIQ9_9PSEU|nr:hypothetical protein [Tamaricihabitans halophyticus]TCP46835.1 hypothetical protein EV191_113112 [Tamaricihabitans halophyticus]